MATAKALSVDREAILARVEAACNDLIDLARPRGHLAEYKARGECSSRAKWLLAAVGKLRRQADGTADGVPDEDYVPTEAEIAAKKAEIRGKRSHANITSYRP